MESPHWISAEGFRNGLLVIIILSGSPLSFGLFYFTWLMCRMLYIWPKKREREGVSEDLGPTEGWEDVE